MLPTTLTDRFWSERQAVVADTTLPSIFEQLEKTGRLENFRRVARGELGAFTGYYFNDSDVYKWIEAASYALRPGSNELQAMVDEAIGLVEAAQKPDGYLNTYFQIQHPDMNFKNLAAMHELYCAGHLFEAAVAHYEATGSERLLAVALKFADLICDTFGPGRRLGYCGHEEIELALIRLSRATGKDRYADTAFWMIEQRGQRPSPFEAELSDEAIQKISPWMRRMLTSSGVYQGEYLQDHAPIREHKKVVGHAVRAMYFYAAATDYAHAAGDEDLLDVLKNLWRNLVDRRLYITGGMGSSGSNEGFTTDYDLPNRTAYAETCAAVGLVFWAKRMLDATGDSEYADTLETALYNGALSGISLEGNRFFYDNPLESRGEHERKEFFECACCPPNIARLLGSVAQYFVSQEGSRVFVHIPAALETAFEIEGVAVTIKVESNYPWSGVFSISVEPAQPVRFSLCIRIPGWCNECTIEGLDEEADFDKGYAVFDREWKAGDRISIDYNMEPKWMESHPAVLENAGRVALTNGPLVYCAEQIDNTVAPQLVVVDTGEPVEIRFESDVLGGVNVLEAVGRMEQAEEREELYAVFDPGPDSGLRLRLIPYFAWANRGATSMQVWMRR